MNLVESFHSFPHSASARQTFLIQSFNELPLLEPVKDNVNICCTRAQSFLRLFGLLCASLPTSSTAKCAHKRRKETFFHNKSNFYYYLLWRDVDSSMKHIKKGNKSSNLCCPRIFNIASLIHCPLRQSETNSSGWDEKRMRWTSTQSSAHWIPHVNKLFPRLASMHDKLALSRLPSQHLNELAYFIKRKWNICSTKRVCN